MYQPNELLLHLALAGHVHRPSKHRGGHQLGPKSKKPTNEIPAPYTSERGARKNAMRKATQLRVGAEHQREYDMQATLGRLATHAERVKAFRSLPSCELLARNLMRGWKPDAATAH